MQEVIVNGSPQQWAVASLSTRQDGDDIISTNFIGQALLNESKDAASMQEICFGADNTTLTLHELMRDALALDLISRFQLTGPLQDVVVLVQSPSTLPLGTKAVLYCLAKNLPVLPISMDVGPDELFTLINACRKRAYRARVVYLAPRELLWRADVVLHQFNACLQIGSLSGEGALPVSCAHNDVTSGVDPVQTISPSSSALELDDVCLYFYDEVSRALYEATQRNVSAIVQALRNKQPSSSNIVTKFTAQAWLGVILPQLLPPPSQAQEVVLYFQQPRMVQLPSSASSPPQLLRRREWTHVAELLLACCKRGKEEHRMEPGRLLVRGPCCFRRALLRGNAPQQQTADFVLDQKKDFTWWFAVPLPSEGIVMDTQAGTQQQLRRFKPVRRPARPPQQQEAHMAKL